MSEAYPVLGDCPLCQTPYATERKDEYGESIWEENPACKKPGCGGRVVTEDIDCDTCEPCGPFGDRPVYLKLTAESDYIDVNGQSTGDLLAIPFVAGSYPFEWRLRVTFRCNGPAMSNQGGCPAGQEQNPGLETDIVVRCVPGSDFLDAAQYRVTIFGTDLPVQRWDNCGDLDLYWGYRPDRRPVPDVPTGVAGAFENYMQLLGCDCGVNGSSAVFVPIHLYSQSPYQGEEYWHCVPGGNKRVCVKSVTTGTPSYFFYSGPWVSERACKECKECKETLYTAVRDQPVDSAGNAYGDYSDYCIGSEYASAETRGVTRTVLGGPFAGGGCCELFLLSNGGLVRDGVVPNDAAMFAAFAPAGEPAAGSRRDNMPRRESQGYAPPPDFSQLEGDW